MTTLEPASIPEEENSIPEQPSNPEQAPIPLKPIEQIPEEKIPQSTQDEPEEAEIDEANKMIIGPHSLPLCPIHKIDASNFCLIENCPMALNCVLCVKEHESLHRIPEMNYSLGLVLNENLADQLFNEKMFQERECKQKIKEMILQVKLNFNRQCDSLETLLIERVETESHEFMLKKIRKFLDKSRDDYKNQTENFSLLKELCSTFNDFLLLKKSDQVPTVDDEISLYNSLMNQFKKTIDLSFKYLNNKICRLQNEPMAAPEIVKMAPSKKSFSEEMKTTVKMPNTQIEMPRHVTVQSISYPPPETVNKANTVQTTSSLYQRESPKNARKRPQRPIKLYKNSQYQIESVEETNINVRGISPGPRRIKKTRVSYTPGHSPIPKRRQSNEKTIQSEHQRDRDFSEFEFEPEMIKRSQMKPSQKYSEMNLSNRQPRSRTPVRQSEHRRQNNQEYTSLLQARNNTQEFDSLNFSNILKDEVDLNFLRNNIFGRKVVYHKLYQGSSDGMWAETFHQKCDNRGPTLCLVRSRNNQKVFGGFAEMAWNPDLNDVNPNFSKFKQSFLFSLKDRSILHLTGKNNSRALGYSEKRGPIFGKFNVISGEKTYYTYDLCINLKVNENKPNYSCSQVGMTYGPVHKHIEGFRSSFLAGDNYFEIDEIEVFQVQF
jgi:hypothetical protein